MFLKVSCKVEAPFVVIVEPDVDPDIVTPVVELLIAMVPLPYFA